MRYQIEKYIDFLIKYEKVLPPDFLGQLKSMRHLTIDVEMKKRNLKALHEIFRLLEQVRMMLSDIAVEDVMFKQRIQLLLNELYENILTLEKRSKENIELQYKNLQINFKQFIGRNNHILLANIFIPNLVKALGYKRIPNIIRKNGSEIQFDVLCVKERILERLQDRRLDEKEVLAVECKNKVKRRDIIKFAEKCEVLKEKFEKEAEIWGYKLKFKSWLVACLGWNDQTITLAKQKNITPIGPSELEKMLKEHHLYDPNVPVCPR